jgi:uncharacterized membrane protein YkoI
MRITAPILLLAAIAAPVGYMATLPAAHGFEKSKSKDEQKRAEQEAIRQAVQRGELLPLPRVLAIAQAKVPGDVVKVELDYEPTYIKYEVKILTAAGRVREVEINARTGSLIKIEDD